MYQEKACDERLHLSHCLDINKTNVFRVLYDTVGWAEKTLVLHSTMHLGLAGALSEGAAGCTDRLAGECPRDRGLFEGRDCWGFFERREIVPGAADYLIGW